MTTKLAKLKDVSFITTHSVRAATDHFRTMLLRNPWLTRFFTPLLAGQDVYVGALIFRSTNTPLHRTIFLTTIECPDTKNSFYFIEYLPNTSDNLQSEFILVPISHGTEFVEGEDIVREIESPNYEQRCQVLSYRGAPRYAAFDRLEKPLVKKFMLACAQA